jgi:hypothetical protein
MKKNDIARKAGNAWGILGEIGSIFSDILEEVDGAAQEGQRAMRKVRDTVVEETNRREEKP